MANLEITTNMQVGTFTVANYEELEKELTTITSKYKNLLVEEKDLPEIKKVMAELNKASKAFNDKRIALEREYKKPFEIGKAQVDNLIRIIKETRESLDVQVKTFENKAKEEKKDEVLNIIIELLGGTNAKYLTAIQLFKEEYLNSSMTMKKVQDDLSTTLHQIDTAMQMLNYFDTQEEKDEVQYEFYQNFNVYDIPKTMLNAMQVVRMRINALNKPTISKANENEKIYTMHYIIKGTKNQLIAIGKMLNNAEIEYSVEKGE